MRSFSTLGTFRLLTLDIFQIAVCDRDLTGRLRPVFDNTCIVTLHGRLQYSARESSASTYSATHTVFKEQILWLAGHFILHNSYYSPIRQTEPVICRHLCLLYVVWFYLGLGHFRAFPIRSPMRLSFATTTISKINAYNYSVLIAEMSGRHLAYSYAPSNRTSSCHQVSIW